MSFMLCGSGRSQAIYDESDKENCVPGLGLKSFRKPATPQMGVSSVSVSTGVKVVPDVNVDLQGMDEITVVLKRGRSGYGFTVMGSSPVRIGRVEENSPAYLAGLRKDDCIVRINGQNVSRSIADSIARIVRQSDRQLILDIQRCGTFSLSSTPVTTPGVTTPRQPFGNINGDQHREGMMLPRKLQLQPIREQIFPATSELSGEGSGTESSQEHVTKTTRLSTPERSSPSRSPFPSPSLPSLTNEERDRQTAIYKLWRSEEQFLDVMHFGIRRYCDPLRHKILSPIEHATLFQNIHQIEALSVAHLRVLHQQSFPLGDNMEGCPERFIDSVGAVYSAKGSEMAELYESYCNGIKPAFSLLLELREYSEFAQFLKEPAPEAGEPTLPSFIQKPLEHIKDLTLILQKILSLTPLSHPDLPSLTAVVQNLRNACNRINECNVRRSQSTLSLASRSSNQKGRSSPQSMDSSPKSVQSDTSPSMMSSQSMHSNATSIASVDSEVMDVQVRLTFCDHVPAFQLATATRHFIYGGELLHICHKQWTRMYVVLMSDLLLLTQVEPDDTLLVLDYPILLHDVLRADFKSVHPCEFTLTLETSQHYHWLDTRRLVLRAPSEELKATWKHILDQRITSCKTQHELMCQGRMADNIV